MIITLDGISKDYARIKGCLEDDFNTVIDNIKYAQEKLEVHIRLNLADNLQSLKALIACFANENLKVDIDVFNIFDTSLSPGEYQDAYRVYTEDHKDLMKYITENGYSYLTGGGQEIPRSRIVCKANTDWRYVIDTQGNLYRCISRSGK